MNSKLEYSKDAILVDLIAILKDMTADWDMEFDGGFGRETRLIADLEFESIDVVQWILSIEESFEKKKMPFEKLIMRDGRYLDEIVVGQAVDFLYEELNKPAGNDGRQ